MLDMFLIVNYLSQNSFPCILPIYTCTSSLSLSDARSSDVFWLPRSPHGETPDIIYEMLIP